jgi:hypothetical protein
MPEPKRLRCPVCDKKFTPRRSDAITCSPACRQKAYRRRQNPPTRTAPKPSAKPEQAKKTSSSKDPRGGAGRKQCRKKVLAYKEMILVGATCEERWRQLMERKALAEYRNQTHVKDINDIRKDIRETGASVVSEDIDRILDRARRDRVSRIPLKRPKGKRELVKREVIRWYRRTRGVVLSPRRVQACWEEYRRSFPYE